MGLRVSALGRLRAAGLGNIYGLSTRRIDYRGVGLKSLELASKDPKNEKSFHARV